MAIIANATVDWRVSPRILTIPAPITEVTVTDLHETLLDLEDEVEGILWEDTRNTSGGEALGGGTTVGVTVELQNTQIAFEARTTPLESGTATSATTVGADGRITLIDTAATFITNNTGRGDIVINITDGSQASVISVTSETELICDTLIGGTDNDFDIADSYDVYDVVQCRVAGGNLVAVDDVGGEITPVFTTFGTQVLLTASSSATAQNQESLEAGLFAGEVVVKPSSPYDINSSPANNAPVGTRQAPVNNFADAKIIADDRGLHNIRITESSTITGVDFSNGYAFVGDSPFYTLTVDPSANMTGCAVNLLSISGELDGLNTIRDSQVGTVDNVSGIMEKCAFKGTITINNPIFMAECYSQVAALGFARINAGGNYEIIMRDFHGSMEISNMTGGDHSIQIYGGRLLINNDCTGGNIYVRGAPYDIVDNSGGAVTLIVQTDNLRLNEIWQRSALDPDNPLVVDEDASFTTGSISVSANTTGTSPNRQTTQTRQ